MNIRDMINGNRDTYRQIRKRLQQIFFNMTARCYNKTNSHYKDYGGRGIRVDWLTFEEFFNWSIDNGYELGLTIDRIDNNGNYHPNNCKWSTRFDQSKNRRNVYSIEGLTLFDWCKKYNVSYHTACKDMQKGLSIEEFVAKRRKV